MQCTSWKFTVSKNNNRDVQMCIIIFTTTLVNPLSTYLLLWVGVPYRILCPPIIHQSVTWPRPVSSWTIALSISFQIRSTYKYFFIMHVLCYLSDWNNGNNVSKLNIRQEKWGNYIFNYFYRNGKYLDSYSFHLPSSFCWRALQDIVSSHHSSECNLSIKKYL